jgi:hypothetical protein
MINNFKKIMNNKDISTKDSIYFDGDNKKYKLINEIHDNDDYKHRVEYNNEIVLYNRYEGYNNNAHSFT